MSPKWQEDVVGTCPDVCIDVVDGDCQEVHQAVSERGAGECRAEGVWLVQPTEGNAAQSVPLQEVDESGGVATLSRRPAKKFIRQGCSMETKMSFVEHRAAEKGSEVHVNWWVADGGFPEWHLLVRSKVNQGVHEMLGHKFHRSR